jgi:hypothetical protein
MLVPKKAKEKVAQVQPAPVNLNINDFRVDLTNDNVTQQICITIDQKTILTYGSLMVLTGKPKARKTTFLHAFLAAGLLNDSIWNIRVTMTKEQPEICLIDTEQSYFDLFQSLKRLAAIVRRPLADIPNFSVYTARAGDVSDICQLIEQILTHNPKIGLLAIDGLLDLVNDINDVRESKAAITFIKKICDKHNVAIIGIIHQNKGTNFSLGHLGAFASRFAQSEFSITKNEDDNTSKLESIYLRSADKVNDIIIDFDQTRNVYDVVSNINKPTKFIDLDVIKKIFEGRVALTYKDLISQTIIQTGQTRYHVEKSIIPVWYAENLIHKVGNLIQIKSPF